ncbi:MAG: hypothetical protein DMF93_10615 [Acidobacteria bacterium]|nr:MAG: hypothetical protein DMF93_10615 [Acidobacteriota bacterium]
MKSIRFIGPLALALALSAAGSVRAAASQSSQSSQTSVTTADIERLQDNIYDASRDIAQLRGRDSVTASQLQAELDEARDDATYLKVKLRRNEPIPRVEYADLRDKIENIRSRARGESAGGYTPPAGSRSEPDRAPGSPEAVRSHRPNEIPVSTEFDVRLQNTLSSRTSQVEDRFETTTMVDLTDERGRVLVPAGSTMRGTVTSVTKATRLERKGSLTVSFDRLTIDHRSYPIRATVTQAIESAGIRGETEKIGIGAGAGAILGAILGGTKGALAGILIGGGGTIAATEGKDVDLPVGTVLRVRMDEPLTLAGK